MSVCSQIAGIKRLGRQLGSQKIHVCIEPVFTVDNYSIDLIQIGMYLREVYYHFFGRVLECRYLTKSGKLTSMLFFSRTVQKNML